MRATKLFLAVLVLLTLVAMTSAIAAKVTDKEILETAKQVMKQDPERAKQMFGDIIARAKKDTPEVGEAHLRLARLEKDPEIALGHFRRAYAISSPVSSEAGMALGDKLWWVKGRMAAAAQFRDVMAKCPDKALDATFHLAKCDLGESRGNLAQRNALRADAFKFFLIVSKARGSEHAFDADVEILAMRMENAKNMKEPYEPLMADMADFAENSKTPAANKCVVLHMLAELYFSPAKPMIAQPELSLEYANQALQIAKDPIDIGWALTMKGVSLQTLSKDKEAIQAFKSIISQFGDADVAVVNMRDNNVVAGAYYYAASSLRKLGREADASQMESKLLVRYPDSIFAQEVKK